jgi:3-oxoacyl-[acyl-carrier protein] reductase
MQGSNVIVTGAAKGIGRVTAGLMAARGAGVAIADIDGEAAEIAAKEIRDAGGKAVAVVGSITTRDSAQAMFDEAVAKLGPIDVLVNNAGIYPRLPILKIMDADWDASFAVNVRGLYNMMVAAVDHMSGRKTGRIVNIASIDAFKPHPKNCHYAAMKAAVVSLTKSFGFEVAPLGILVNGVAPGGPISTDTAMNAGWLPSIVAETPIGFTAKPEDISEVICFVASPANRFMVGETIVVSGGYYIP